MNKDDPWEGLEGPTLLADWSLAMNGVMSLTLSIVSANA
jgi:hypothetical protein